MRIGDWWAGVRGWWRDHERARNQLAAVQSALVSVAVLVGGGWTLAVFVVLRGPERVEAELAALRKHPVANVTLQTSEVALPGDRAHYLHAVVGIENIGNQPTALDFRTRAPLRVTEMLRDSSAGFRAGRTDHVQVWTLGRIRDSIQGLPKASLLPGERAHYEFLVPVRGPGAYFVQFQVPFSVGRGIDSAWFWSARSIAIVKPRTTAP